MNNLLTAELVGINITSPFPHEAVGICNPKHTGQQRPLLSVVFLCPSKIINKGLLPVLSFMTDCYRQLSSWPIPVFGIANLFQSVTHKFAIMCDGLKLYIGETAMRNHNQKPTDHVSLKSIFSLVDSRHNLITSSLTIEQAKVLSEHIRGSIIKFQAMVKVEVLS